MNKNYLLKSLKNKNKMKYHFWILAVTRLAKIKKNYTIDLFSQLNMLNNVYLA